jgi:hypothetical protein
MNAPRAVGLVFLACGACANAPAPPASAANSAPVPSAATTAAPAPSQPAAPATATDVVASHRASLDACYAQARSVDPNLGPTSVEITFTIDADGKAKTVDLRYRHRMDDRAKECLRDAALALQFPASLAGTQTAKVAFEPPGR